MMTDTIPHDSADPLADYERVTAAIRYLSETPPEALDLARFARALELNERRLTDLFRRWCGLSPKSFAQAVALDHAKRLLTAETSVMQTTLDVGLSSSARLHDLFVAHEAMPPGAWRDRGEGLDMVWGVAPSPFGLAVLFVTRYGLAGLGFVEKGDLMAAYADLADRWPRATFRRDDALVAPLATRIFNPAQWRADAPVRVVLIGTDFEVRVWEGLLGIGLGQITSYGALATRLDRPGAARAVGRAVGRNPISFVVPCHRVVGQSGALTGYHWGMTRKRAILGWERGVSAPET